MARYLLLLLLLIGACGKEDGDTQVEFTTLRMEASATRPIVYVHCSTRYPGNEEKGRKLLDNNSATGKTFNGTFDFVQGNYGWITIGVKDDSSTGTLNVYHNDTLFMSADIYDGNGVNNGVAYRTISFTAP